MSDFISFKIGGMACPSCSGKLESALRSTAGVINANVSLDPGQASIQYDETKVQSPALLEVVENQGFDILT